MSAPSTNLADWIKRQVLCDITELEQRPAGLVAAHEHMEQLGLILRRYLEEVDRLPAGMRSEALRTCAKILRASADAVDLRVLP